jgi:hypothetical protein
MNFGYAIAIGALQYAKQFARPRAHRSHWGLWNNPP